VQSSRDTLSNIQAGLILRLRPKEILEGPSCSESWLWGWGHRGAGDLKRVLGGEEKDWSLSRKLETIGIERGNKISKYINGVKAGKKAGRRAEGLRVLEKQRRLRRRLAK